MLDRAPTLNRGRNLSEESIQKAYKVYIEDRNLNVGPMMVADTCCTNELEPLEPFYQVDQSWAYWKGFGLETLQLPEPYRLLTSAEWEWAALGGENIILCDPAKGNGYGLRHMGEAEEWTSTKITDHIYNNDGNLEMTNAYVVKRGNRDLTRSLVIAKVETRRLDKWLIQTFGIGDDDNTYRAGLRICYSCEEQ